MKAKKQDDVEKFYRVEITRNKVWADEPAYLREFGHVLNRINAVFDTEKMQQHVRKIEGNDVKGDLECDTYGLSHLKILFKLPYFKMTKVLI